MSRQDPRIEQRNQAGPWGPENDGASLEVRPGMPRRPVVVLVIATGAIDGDTMGIIEGCASRDLTTRAAVGTEVEAELGFAGDSVI